MSINKDKLKEYIHCFCISLFIILIYFIIVLACSKNKQDKTTSPVEEIILIDSLNKTNTKLIIEVEILDSVKDVKKDKVLTLDNDSTLRLFYELLRK